MSKLDNLSALLETHIMESLSRNHTNSQYAEVVRQRAEHAKSLIKSRSGFVSGLVMAWMEDIRPVAEAVFGTTLEDTSLGDHKEFSPTVFEGVLARTRVLSVDEIFGPTVALDLAAQTAVKVNPY